MKRILLLFFLLSSNFITYAFHNDYYVSGYSFDDFEVGKTFQVVTSKGEAVEGASAVVEADQNNPQNKVLHVTTGELPGFVELDNPDNMSAATLKKYPFLTLSIKSKNAYDNAANCHFEVYYGSISAYKDTDSKPSVFEAGVWKDCMYSPVSPERSPREKIFRLGLNAANADYYIDDIVFLCSEDAYEQEAEAKERARRDSIMQAIEEAYAAASEELDERVKNMDQLLAYDFENFEVGTTFPVYTLKGTDPLEGASAVVEIDKNGNKYLHVTSIDGQIGYVELDNPTKEGGTGPLSVTTLLNLSKELSISIKRVDDVSGDAAFDIAWGGSYAHKTAPDKELTKNRWVDNIMSLDLERSSRAKAMRIGLHAEGAEFYLDNLVFLMSEYDMSRPETTVRYWADKLGKNFGTCVNPGIGDDDFGKTVYNNFNLVVAENAMKMNATEPGNNQFNFSQGDNIVTWAKKHGLKVRGHTLCWHSQIPSWMGNSDSGDNPNKWTKKQLLDILKNHVMTVAAHYAGDVIEWDVVNECLQDGQSGSGYTLRSNSLWYSVIGEEFIDSAFVWARRADPNAKLYLNDYSVGMWNSEGGKTKAMYNLAKRLKDSGIPIDGVGFQTHTSVSGFNPAEVEISIQKFREIGLNVIITEMDMPGGQVNGWGDNAQLVRSANDEDLQIQAQKYAQMVDIMIRYDNTPSLLVWGVRDNQSWLKHCASTKPLLFFEDLTPHQAYIDVRKTYQKRALLMTGVDPIPADDSDNPVWYSPEPKTKDVFDIVGRKVLSNGTFEQIEELPAGLYIIGGKKYMIRH